MSEIPLDGFKRADGWFNVFSGHGDSNYSKSENSGFTLDLLDDTTVENLWRGDDIAARIIETLPSESFRQKFKIHMEDKEQAEALLTRSQELGFIQTYIDAKEKERAFGGSAIYPVINDGVEDLSQPLNMDRIGRIENMLVLEPRELQPISWYDRINHPKFGKPSVYSLQPKMQSGAGNIGSEYIHESRLIIFHGRMVTRGQASVRAGWGDSVMNRVWRVLRDFNISWGSAAELLNDFAQAVFKIKGLAELIAKDKDEVIKARIRAAQLSRSAIRATMMDAEEDFERKATPMSGMPEMLDRFSTRLAAAADMPVTLLMGQSPSGLNATGESDIRFFYDRVAADRERRTHSQLEQGIRLLTLEKDGATKGAEPDSWSVVFNPLWQPSQQEETTTRKTQADTDVAYINAGVVSPEEVAIHRFGGDSYSYELNIDIDEREKIAAEMDEDQEGDAELTEDLGNSEATGEENVAATAMNGAQVGSLIDIIARVGLKELSRASGKAIIMTAFPTVDEARAEALLGPEDFAPVMPEVASPPPLPEPEEEQEDE